MADCRIKQYFFWNKTDDLAPRYLRSFGVGAHLHEIERVVKRSLFRIDEIHRDLGLSVHFQSKSLHVFEPARRAPHSLGDVLRNLKIGGGSEIDVVRDEKGTRSDRNRSARRMDLLRSEIR